MNRCAEYLSGTAAWEQWNIRERLKGTREFKDLGVADFRTKQDCCNPGCNNLGYGTSVPDLLSEFIDDLLTVPASLQGRY